ncbi:MAG TPA: N-acetylmuramic acid 6-phosphate etherase, partial [Candidatus Dormibacteraeota bacterium]|nr:N-acetylmuramic acid 6-phosphate etherase [Candidatus Dormibacteraeota bacterium]
VLIVSGTGSSCFAKGKQGRVIKVGGWGHILGDKGSGYEIGLRGIKAALHHYDQAGVWPKLGEQLLRSLQLNEPADLIPWAQFATKTQIASLAIDVFAAWERGDKIAKDILTAAANILARDAVACARRAFGTAPNKLQALQFVLAGSNLLKQPRFARLVRKELRTLCPRAAVVRLHREGVWGAVELARLNGDSHDSVPSRTPARAGSKGKTFERPTVRSSALSPTERRNLRSMNLDKLSLPKAVNLMLSEEARIPQKLAAKSDEICRVIEAITRAFRRGGRLFYVGAGTSGRLGVLDASECPPTFRSPPDQVQGIIAGGEVALRNSVEGAEDDRVAGGRAVEFRGIDSRDVVVGIAASGTTPFVWGALTEAKRRRAPTVLLCFNPHLLIPRELQPSITIDPDLGGEVLTGSTRLKAGTATKLLLNMFTTLAMVRSGKVLSNLMVDLNASNKKLRDRAARIVQDLTGADYSTSWSALKRNGWIIKKAVSRLRAK